MSCEICGRSSCTRSFHSLKAQEDFDTVANLSERELKLIVLDLREEVAELKAEAARNDHG
jgi:hypothetical protein